MDIVEIDGVRVPTTYLGDAVYCLYDGDGYWLRLSDHRNAVGQIYLEPSVLNSLWTFATECNKLRMKLENERKESENLASPINKQEG
jgi:hypothetical protein